MRDKPRYSIIPAGAVTDPRLKGWDLQVLCLLGCHSDKLGWCEASSQSELADAINCGRSTFQRSINRLVESGWVQTRAACVSHSGRSYASYAYRVVMDRDDIGSVLTEHEVAAPTPDDDAHGRAPCPPIAGQPCPRMHGQQESDQQETKNVVVSVCDGHSTEAAKIADEIAEIAKVDSAKHGKWFQIGPAVIVQQFLDGGYLAWQLIEGARRGMATRTEAPQDIRYFKPLWQRVRGESETPAPLPTTSSQPKLNRNGRMADAHNYLDDVAAGRPHTNDGGTRGDSGQAPHSGLPVPKRA